MHREGHAVNSSTPTASGHAGWRTTRFTDGIARLTTLVAIVGTVALVVVLSAPTAAASAPAPSKSQARFEIRYMKFSIDHHAQGITLAKLCLQKAQYDPLKDNVCAPSIPSQERQIAQLEKYLKEWYGITYTPKKVIPPQYNHLRELSGARFDIEFMEVFSEHHLKIISKSTDCLARAYHEQLRTNICVPIIMEQSKSVNLMRTYLCERYDVCDPKL